MGEKYIMYFIYDCKNCGLGFGSFDEFEKCPSCGGEIVKKEQRLEKREGNVLRICRSCNLLLSADKKICSCGKETEEMFLFAA